MIALRHISKVYAKGKTDVAALKDISLDIRSGAFLALQGPSGSGKTTLLNIIGMLDWPSGGAYSWEGQEITQLSDRQISKIRNQRIGFIFQSFNLLPQYSAWENVALPLTYARASRQARKKRALEALEMVGLLDRAEHLPAELSGGQEQRVAIARALVNNPSLILADEPTGNLDSDTSKRIMELLLRVHRETKTTLLIVTHDSVIAGHADNILHLIDGKVQPQDVCDQATIVA